MTAQLLHKWLSLYVAAIGLALLLPGDNMQTAPAWALHGRLFAESGWGAVYLALGAAWLWAAYRPRGWRLPVVAALNVALLVFQVVGWLVSNPLSPIALATLIVPVGLIIRLVIVTPHAP